MRIAGFARRSGFDTASGGPPYRSGRQPIEDLVVASCRPKTAGSLVSDARLAESHVSCGGVQGGLLATDERDVPVVNLRDPVAGAIQPPERCRDATSPVELDA